MHEYIKRRGQPGPTESNAELVESGALEIFIGNAHGSEWSGHMAIVIPNYFGGSHALIDLTAAQGDVPERGILLKPLCLEVSDDFVQGSQPHYQAVGECHLIYRAYPNDHNYDTGNNWLAMPGLDRAVLMVRQRLSN